MHTYNPHNSLRRLRQDCRCVLKKQEMGAGELAQQLKAPHGGSQPPVTPVKRET